MEDEFEARITTFIRDRFLEGDPASEIQPNTPLLEWGVLNSLNMIELLTYIREDLGVSVPASAINALDFKDIQAITALVRRLARTPAN
jgi:clorobiocin biosynthesis protein CloN5